MDLAESPSVSLLPFFPLEVGSKLWLTGRFGELTDGGTFNDEKEGLKIPFQQGTVAMANSGKSSNTSQVRCPFFLLS